MPMYSLERSEKSTGTVTQLFWRPWRRHMRVRLTFSSRRYTSRSEKIACLLSKTAVSKMRRARERPSLSVAGANNSPP